MSTDFNGFGLAPKILQALARLQFTTPTPVQTMTLPLALAGRDILGSAQTGTGKTFAYGIPLIMKLMDNPEATALVLTPTRELATQVLAALQQIIPVPTIRTALLIGGEPMPKQYRQLHAQPRLIVGTPGRINDHLQRGSLKLNKTRCMVLDETDRMLDMGFGVQIEKIVKHVPSERQTMMFSATLPSSIVKLSSRYLNNPERISVGSTTATAPNIRQELIKTTESDKYTRLLEQLKNITCTTIIFVKTKYGTEKLADKLSKLNLMTDALHGDLRQSRRDKVVQRFRDKKFQILVATDVAARGLDVPHIELVINYDLPQCPEDYIHRIGRTARAGASGKAVNLLAPGDHEKWRAIHRLINPAGSDDGLRGERGEPAKRSSGRKYDHKSKGRFRGQDRNQSQDRSRSPDRDHSHERSQRQDRPHNPERAMGHAERVHSQERPKSQDRSHGQERSQRQDRPHNPERATGHAERMHSQERPKSQDRSHGQERSQRQDRPKGQDRYKGQDRPKGQDRRQHAKSSKPYRPEERAA